MESVQQTLEVERIVNIARGFGWDRVKEEVQGDKLIITIEKTIESPAVSES